jgi:hypothetical protein
MRREIRKAYSEVHITYQNENYTNNLNAENFTIDANPERVIWSMDFSTNQRTRHKDSNSYLDAQQLLEDWGNVKFFQIFEEKLCKEIRDVADNMEPTPWFVEMRFKDGEAHTLPVRLRGHNGMIQMNVNTGGAQ